MGVSQSQFHDYKKDINKRFDTINSDIDDLKANHSNIDDLQAHMYPTLSDGTPITPRMCQNPEEIWQLDTFKDYINSLKSAVSIVIEAKDNPEALANIDTTSVFGPPPEQTLETDLKTAMCACQSFNIPDAPENLFQQCKDGPTKPSPEGCERLDDPMSHSYSADEIRELAQNNEKCSQYYHRVATNQEFSFAAFGGESKSRALMEALTQIMPADEQ